MKINLIPRVFLNILVFFIVVLSIGNVISIILIFSFKLQKFNAIIGLLNFNSEGSFSTLFSFLILLISSLLLKYIAFSQKFVYKTSKYWKFLALIFLFLSLDEMLSIHEMISGKIENYYKFSGFLYYAWVLPYGIFVIFISLIYMRFIGRLPLKFKFLFISAGFIYVFGAIGFEMFGGFVIDKLNHEVEFNILYHLLYSLEETFEMFGITLFIYSLLEYICVNKFKPIKINFKIII